VALGGFDLGVATRAAELYHEGCFPWLVVTGATSRTTAQRFPDGEAAAYRERLLAQGVPDDVILVEPHATNTGENIAYSRGLLERRGIEVSHLMIICMPSMERRAWATCTKQWPEITVSCASQDVALEDYIGHPGNGRTAVEEIVGDLQRLWVHADQGFAVEQPVPPVVLAAYHRLVAAGFDSKVLS
jgi:uncharacterized SAM-binding protein YcdF (DUF218 family)